MSRSYSPETGFPHSGALPASSEAGERIAARSRRLLGRAPRLKFDERGGIDTAREKEMAMDEEKPIRIVDRRMFTPDGELRPEFQAEEASRPAAAPAPGPARPVEPASPPAGEETVAPEEEPRPESQEPRSDFASLVRSLATTAYSALGLLPDPSGSRRRDVGVARQMIDWLAALELKTRGNISFEEADLLAKVLYELRLAFVEITRSPAK
jgi:hypothetical protein